MNWLDVLPHLVARQQTGWERDQRVLRAREAGVTLRAIGNSMGLSHERIRQMEFKGRRTRLRAPLDIYLSRHGVDERRLRKFFAGLQ